MRAYALTICQSGMVGELGFLVCFPGTYVIQRASLSRVWRMRLSGPDDIVGSRQR